MLLRIAMVYAATHCAANTLAIPTKKNTQPAISQYYLALILSTT